KLLLQGTELYHGVIRASLLAAGIVAGVAYMLQFPLSRAFFVIAFLLAPPALLLVRYAARRVLHAFHRSGRGLSRVLLVGEARQAADIAAVLRRERWLGYSVLGRVAPIGERADAVPLADIDIEYRGIETVDVERLGTVDRLLDVLHRMRPQILLFTEGAVESAISFRRLAWDLETHGIDVIVVPALTEISSDRVRMRPVAGLPLVHMELPRAREALKWSKRAFDLIASTSLLFLGAPLLAVIALGVKLSDGGSVLFRQERVGRGGQTFQFLKFRSMVPDAETHLSGIRREHQDRGNDIMFKMADDPRVTRIGRILRRYSLDELPQLWNVLRGDMSLVGPRPALPREVSVYDSDASRRLAVRPGITGLWQVSGRSDLSWEETVRLDLYYVDNWSFTQDAQILLRTVRAVIAPSGAY
ncbi:MAG: sugar transferase, partial [Brachybacterium sp.]|nr:sugar transferase [Brachybacterium sp.]